MDTGILTNCAGQTKF